MKRQVRHDLNKNELSDIEKGDILESVLWQILQHYIRNKYTVNSTIRLGWQHEAKDGLRYFTADGRTIELLWLRPNNHESGSHKPDFSIAVDSQTQVVVEAKNWKPPPNIRRTEEEIITRYEAFKKVPYKLLVITTPIYSGAKTLLNEQHIVVVMVYPQIYSSEDQPQITKIKKALLPKLP